MEIKPSEDGITHINVYSKGSTELGRLLSNFAYTPFRHPTYERFASVEAFWYWLSLDKKYDQIKPLFGYKCKQTARELIANGAVRVSIDDFKEQIKEAITLKLQQHPGIVKLLKDTKLPLTHYYVYGKIMADPDKYKIIFPKDSEWILDHIETFRDS